MFVLFIAATQMPECYPHFEKAVVTSGNLRNHRGDLEVYPSRYNVSFLIMHGCFIHLFGICVVHSIIYSYASCIIYCGGI